MFIDGNELSLPAELWQPFENPNLSLEVCFPVRIGDLFDYPYREIWVPLEAVSYTHLTLPTSDLV